MEVILLIIGFIIIIKAADVLVDAASSLAYTFKIPKMLIALTIVSFGTSAPEMAISFQSIQEQNSEIAFSNVIGSCIVNTFLIIGLASLIRPIKVKHATIKKELPILFLITTAFSIIMIDNIYNPLTTNNFSRADGIILVLLFSLFVVYLVQMLFHKKQTDEPVEIKYSITVSIFLLIITIILIVFSSDLIVNNAQIIAEKLNVSEKIITMIAIVIGTSLPEMVMTITSARKGEFDIAVGNIIGTNIFNTCIVLGLPIAIYGDITLTGFSFIDIFAVFLTSALLYIFAKSEKTISRQEGIIMLLIFALYYTYLFI